MTDFGKILKELAILQKAWRSGNERKIFVESIGAPNIQSLCYAHSENIWGQFIPRQIQREVKQRYT